jgi:hypothetical protein
MGIVELIIVVLLLLWLFGYFGRGRFFSGTPALASGNLIHTLLVIVVILVILRLLNLI